MHRARDLLINTSQSYPSIFTFGDEWIENTPRNWPDYIYLPTDPWIILNKQRKDLDLPNIAILQALSAWRMTQGIYRFDPALYPVLIDTPVAGNIPAEIILQLPEWCIYIETPDLEWEEAIVAGAWVFIDHDFYANNTDSLVFLLDIIDSDPFPLVLHLNQSTLDETLAVFFNSEEGKIIKNIVEPLLSLVLYICSQNDFSNKGIESLPTNPIPRKTKKGLRLFQAGGSTTWDVGVRIGAALRQAYQSEQAGYDSLPTGQKVRPHVRRAHWHTFVSGPRIAKDGSEIPANKRKRDLKWVPPIAVNVENLNEMPSVIRKVN